MHNNELNNDFEKAHQSGLRRFRPNNSTNFPGSHILGQKIMGEVL